MGYYPKNFKKKEGWVPKKRYSIMKKRMKMTGSHGLELMSSTCCIQTNLDYENENDMFSREILFWNKIFSLNFEQLI